MMSGFHNSPADLSENQDKITDYVSSSAVSGFGLNWGNIMAYRNGVVQECSVSNVTSSSAANADALFFYGGFKDLLSTGTPHSQTWYYYDCSRAECADLPWC